MFDYTIILSAISITMLWLIGSKKRYAWIFGLFSQCLWFYFIFDKKIWGLAPMHIVYTVIYTRNWFKWKEVNN